MRYDAKAIGSGSEAAQSELQDKWHKVSVDLSAVIQTLTLMLIGDVFVRGTNSDVKNIKTGDGRKA